MTIATSTTCRSCDMPFEDINGHRLCDICLVDRVNGAGELELDDPDDAINFVIPRASQTARRTCRACDASYVVTLDYDGPPLCGHCRADIGATRANVQAWLHDVLTQMDVAIVEWDAIREPRQAYWEKIQDARERPGYAEKVAAHRAAQNAYGQLLDAEAAWLRTMDALGVERARLETAIELIDSL